MLLARYSTHRRAIAANVAVAFLLAFMCGMVSLNGDAGQIAFNRGAMWLIALMTVVYLAISMFLLGRPHGAWGEWFIARGAMALMPVMLLIYVVLASLVLGRVV